MNPIGKKKAPAPPPRVEPAAPLRIEGKGPRPAPVLDDRGGGIKPTFGRFLAEVDPKVAEGVLVGLSGGVKGLTRFLDHPPTKESELRAQLATRLEKLAKDLQQALSDGVQVALHPDQREVIRDSALALGALLEALPDARLPHKFPASARLALEQLRALTAAIPSAPTATEPLILLVPNAKSPAELFDGPLPTTGAVAIYSDGPATPTQLGWIAERAKERADGLRLVDINDNEGGRIFAANGQLSTDHLAFAVAQPELWYQTSARPSELLSLVQSLQRSGVASASVVVDGPFDASWLEALRATMAARPGLKFELRDPKGQVLAAAESDGSLSLGPPQPSTQEVHHALRGLIRDFLYGDHGPRLRLRQVGEVQRVADGLQLRLNSGATALHRDLRGEFLAHRSALALGESEANAPAAEALRGLVHAALTQAERQADGALAELLGAPLWEAVEKNLSRLAPVQHYRALFNRVAQDIGRYSEHPERIGFGLGSFQGVALGSNAAALFELLAASSGPSELASTLSQVGGVLGDQGGGVSVHGASVAILLAKTFGERARRSSATDEHTALLRLIEEALRSNPNGEVTCRIGCMPTDPGLGAAHTPTPDFVVERIGPKEHRATFIDAKSIDAERAGTPYIKNIEGAVHQVLAHRFQLAAKQDGWPMIRFYRAPTSAEGRAQLFELVRQGLKKGLVAHPELRAKELRALVVLEQAGKEESHWVDLSGERPQLDKLFGDAAPGA